MSTTAAAGESGAWWPRVRRWLPSSIAFGVVRFDQGEQRSLGNKNLNLSEELIAFGLLLGHGELAIREPELLAANYFSSGLRSQLHCREEGLASLRFD